MKNIKLMFVLLISGFILNATNNDPLIPSNPDLKNSDPIMISGLPAGVNIYPNPATEYFFIEAVNEDIYFNHLIIKDMNGRLLKEWPLPHHTPHIRIDVHDLTPGMYIAQIHTKGAIYNTKIFKARR